MCIIARKAHLSDTLIFTCVCGSSEGKATRQFVMYQNKVTFTDKGVTENLMALPIPLEDGLVPKEHILLYDCSAENKGDLQRAYKDFFKNIEKSFEELKEKSNGPRSYSMEKSKQKHLEVVKVGGYQCSLARTPGDVLNLDPSVFGTPVGLQEVLEKNYAHNFAFLIARFSQDPKKSGIELHPIGYSSPIQSSGKLFIPTRHYHGDDDGADASKVDDWDHNIYVLGGERKDFKEIIDNADRVLGGARQITPLHTELHGDAFHVVNNLFTEQHKKDEFPVDYIASEKTACKLHIKGRFDNLDFTTSSLLAHHPYTRPGPPKASSEPLITIHSLSESKPAPKKKFLGIF